MNRLIPAVGAGVLVVGAAIAGCQKTGSGHVQAQASAAESSASAKAQAEASALATNPQVLHDETQTASKIASCASAQGVTVAFTGSGQNLRARVTHTSLSFVEHPFKGFAAMAQCAGATTADAHNVEVCAQNVAQSNGLGSGTLSKDLVGAANCVGQQMVNGSTK